MKYVIDIKKIWTAHNNAWNAMNRSHRETKKEIDALYTKTYGVKLIRYPDNGLYKSVEFTSKSAYVMFILEWS